MIVTQNAIDKSIIIGTPCAFVVTAGLLFCIDGIPAFAANTVSLKPAEFVNLSLPPAVRSKVENMLLLMLLPSSMKAEDAKKYYDFASTYEFQDMYTNGTCRLLLGIRYQVTRHLFTHNRSRWR